MWLPWFPKSPTQTPPKPPKLIRSPFVNCYSDHVDVGVERVNTVVTVKLGRKHKRAVPLYSRKIINVDHF